MRRAPRAQFGVGGIARINVSEGGGFGIASDGKFEGKVAGLFPHGSVIGAAGNPVTVDAQQIKESDLFLLAGKPGKFRVFQNEIEREQPPEKQGIFRLPAVPDVLNSQLPVDRFMRNPATPRHAVTVS